MLEQINSLLETTLSRLHECDREEAFLTLKSETFGKKSPLTELLKGVKDLSSEERATVGKQVNEVRDELEKAFWAKQTLIEEAEIRWRIESEREDMTVPYALRFERGHEHILLSTMREIEDIFLRMGFESLSSPEVTTEYDNFTAVNVPAAHPARDMQDTFWLEGGRVLATQTSCMQNWVLKNKPCPIRAIIPGRVFRNEDLDATHETTFYQVEGIAVEKGQIHMGHLKYTIETFLSELFKKEVSIRMRPGYFPFVEPGVEVDFSCPFCDGKGCRICKYSTWVEMMGAGLIHPNVLTEGGLDPNEYSGFAFGFGVNRLVMMRHGVTDIRHFMASDKRFLEQF